MSSMTVSTPDGEFNAYVAAPDSTPAPGIVVIQEIFGVNHFVRETCDWLAGAGFLAVAPDLFWRIEPGVDITDKTQEEWDKAFDLMGKFDADKGAEDIQATISAVRGRDDCTGKVGVIGYCLGGKMAYLAATRTDADASVGYYGVQIDALLDEASNISKPLMLHIAGEDGFVPREAQDKVIEGLKDNPLATTYRYEGQDHAFARTGGEHYDAESAKLANDRTLAFFSETLS